MWGGYVRTRMNWGTTTHWESPAGDPSRSRESAPMNVWIRNVLRAGAGAVLLAASLTACGGSSGPPTLTWYINPDNGAQAKLAQECTAAAGGKYKITTNILPNDVSQQRQQLVTRLAA